jgi:hypothetical protein
MLTQAQLDKSKQFIYRHGRLLDRKRFAYHFEGGSKQAVLDALACYQNDDGGFGHGLELDVMCPHSSPICTEVGLAILLECDAGDSTIADRAERWILAAQRESGELVHPENHIRNYPHGNWWLGDDAIRVFAIAGLLARLGRGTEQLYARAAALFQAKYSPFPAEVSVYDYPLHLYLNYASDVAQFADERAALRVLMPDMLAKAAWHCPLFFCHDRWYSEDIPAATWREEATKAVSTLQEDGGVSIVNYENLSWWRPVWTLEMLVRLQMQGLLKSPGEPSLSADAEDGAAEG